MLSNNQLVKIDYVGFSVYNGRIGRISGMSMGLYIVEGPEGKFNGLWSERELVPVHEI